MTIQDTEVLALFEQEAAERLGALSDLLLELESNGLSDDLVGKLFREAHTLKGAANVVGMIALGTEAHALEDLFDGVRAGTVPVTPELVDQMLAAVDRLIALSGLELSDRGPDRGDEADLVDETEAVQADQPDPAPDLGAEFETEFQPDLELEVETTPRAGRTETARVSIDRLDELVRLAGETAASHLRLAELVRDRLGIDPYTVPEMRDMNRLLNELQERALRARMLPMAAASPVLRRAVRDLARRTGKQIEIEFRGEDTELDRTVHERLVDALIHIVRNAVDHGIEPVDERRAAGKSPTGRIIVHAMQLGPRVIVTVTDDGAGVDRDAVRRRAGALGIDVSGLDDEATLDLLFHPGLTTSMSLTEVSGRGVGLDAVRDSLASLRGRVDARSTPGSGSTFRISVPITLTVLRGLIVRVGEQRYAIPMGNVVAVFGADTPLDEVEGRPAVRVGRSVVGVTPLGHLVGGQAAGEGPIVAITGVNQTHAFCVDLLEGERDVLLKSLPAVVPTSGLLVGASAEPDSSVMLVLDAESLVDRAVAQQANGHLIARNSTTPATLDHPRRILVVDDALTVRELQRSILERAGFVVTMASDGREALERLDEADPDLVLTDVEMPELDGLGLTRAIRALDRWTNLPVVILTSRSEDADRQAGLEAGADAYIVKAAFDEAALLGVVERLLGVGV